MGKPTGFLEIERQDRTYEAVDARLKTWNEFVQPLAGPVIAQQAARCMDCGIPFCHQGCPVNNQIPDFNNLVYRDQCARRWTTCSPPTTFRSSPAASAPHPARHRAR